MKLNTTSLTVCVDILYITKCRLFTTVSSSDFVHDTTQNAVMLVGKVVIASIHFKVVIMHMTLQSVGLVRGVRILNYTVFVS
jgi:hypothetical protein